MRVCAVIIVVLSLALGVQSLRVAHMETELAVKQGALDQSETQVHLLEDSEKALKAARSGLTAQVEDCQKINARSKNDAKARMDIVSRARTVPAKPEEVPDAQANREIIEHINAAIRRINAALGRAS